MQYHCGPACWENYNSSINLWWYSSAYVWEADTASRPCQHPPGSLQACTVRVGVEIQAFAITMWDGVRTPSTLRWTAAKRVRSQLLFPCPCSLALITVIVQIQKGYISFTLILWFRLIPSPTIRTSVDMSRTYSIIFIFLVFVACMHWCLIIWLAYHQGQVWFSHSKTFVRLWTLQATTVAWAVHATTQSSMERRKNWMFPFDHAYLVRPVASP